MSNAPFSLMSAPKAGKFVQIGVQAMVFALEGSAIVTQMLQLYIRGRTAP